MKNIVRSLLDRSKTVATAIVPVLQGKSNQGYCYVCGKRTLFVEYGPALRDSYGCIRCQSRPRQRALMRVLEEQFPNWRSQSVYESSPSGPCSAQIRKQCAQYDESQYFETVPYGELKDGFRCENLESLSMPDDSYDLVITQDVFEHVLNPKQAFREVARVLKPGGAHVFTVPIVTRGKSVICAEDDGAGGITYLKPPSYHRNPVDPNGSLVVTEWGDDLAEIIDESSGLSTEVILHKERALGLDGRLLEVVVSKKPV